MIGKSAMVGWLYRTSFTLGICRQYLCILWTVDTLAVLVTLLRSYVCYSHLHSELNALRREVNQVFVFLFFPTLFIISLSLCAIETPHVSSSSIPVRTHLLWNPCLYQKRYNLEHQLGHLWVTRAKMIEFSLRS